MFHFNLMRPYFISSDSRSRKKEIKVSMHFQFLKNVIKRKIVIKMQCLGNLIKDDFHKFMILYYFS